MSEPRRYDHLLRRVEYPRERGYRMEPRPLPYWIYVTIADIGDSKVLTVHSRIHMNKSVVMNPQYSTNYTDDEIIRDMSGKISHDFL